MTQTAYAQVNSALKIVKKYLNEHIFGKDGPTAYKGWRPPPPFPLALCYLFLDTRGFALQLRFADPLRLSRYTRGASQGQEDASQIPAVRVVHGHSSKKTQWKVTTACSPHCGPCGANETKFWVGMAVRDRSGGKISFRRLPFHPHGGRVRRPSRRNAPGSDFPQAIRCNAMHRQDQWPRLQLL